MTFKSYLDNIEAKTGMSAEDFKKLAEEKGEAGDRREVAVLLARPPYEADRNVGRLALGGVTG